MESKGVFIGQNGSMGFFTGHEYLLNLSIRHGYIWIQCGTVACPYSTMKALLKNWKFI